VTPSFTNTASQCIVLADQSSPTLISISCGQNLSKISQGAVVPSSGPAAVTIQMTNRSYCCDEDKKRATWDGVECVGCGSGDDVGYYRSTVPCSVLNLYYCSSALLGRGWWPDWLPSLSECFCDCNSALRSASASYRARGRRAEMVLDSTTGCWCAVPGAGSPISRRPWMPADVLCHVSQLVIGGHISSLLASSLCF